MNIGRGYRRIGFVVMFACFGLAIIAAVMTFTFTLAHFNKPSPPPESFDLIRAGTWAMYTIAWLVPGIALFVIMRRLGWFTASPDADRR